MTGKKRVCAKEDCNIEFVMRSHNQIFCSKEHQRIVTNQKIMEKYYEKKAQRSGQLRICSECKETRLSRYNDEKICLSCLRKAADARDKKAFEELSRFRSP